MADFVHLTVHSEYSLVDGVVRVPALLEQIERLGMPAVALTDQSNVFAMVKLYRGAVSRGIQPIIGADVWVGESVEERDPHRLTLLCADAEGFGNLSRLLTLGYAQAQHHGRAIVLKRWLAPEAVRGLIALSGGQFGEVGRTLLGANPDRAPALLEAWTRRFPGRYYLELHRVGRPGENDHVARAVNLASARGVPVVATNDVRFVAPEDFEAHETRICIQQGRTLQEPDRPRDFTENQYLKSPAEMAALFADLPEALANSVTIAQRCSLQLPLGELRLPSFQVPNGKSAAEYLKERARDGLARRGLEANPPRAGAPGTYAARLEQELEVICNKQFAGYFLIVADFIGWARDNGIPVGPGRGSGAGSLVAYVLGITDLNPIEHDLLFERFLNPERDSMPDFDIDFCINGRDRVIEYVAQRYGRDRVSQIITFGSMAARAVVRDVGRALGMPYADADRIAKLIPPELGITLDKALANDEELRGLYEAEDEVRTLIDLARQLEGLARNAGTHAGGVVIAPEPLTQFMPLYHEPDGGALTQLDKDDVEAIGLVKFDFLGLKTLTIIDRALRSINRERDAAGEPPLRAAEIPLDDPQTYELLRSCRTTGVFQLESRGMRDLIKRLQPDHFDDLTAINALFRPGPLQSGMVEDFINRKHGKNAESIEYFHPCLEPILRATYGVILYQEQVMQIAQVMAGYSLGGADLLRQAMGKKLPEKMAQQRSVFLAGAAERGIDEKLASHVFDLMEKFAGYGFNKSHSTAYALIACQTAWLKAHFPAAFMAAVLSAEMNDTDKLVLLKDDCLQLGIRIAVPDINVSRFEFTVAGEQSIAYGLGAIKGVGQGVVDHLIAEREANGPYTSLLDLCRRVDPQRLNRRVLEALVRSGALGALGENRATLMGAIPNALRFAEHAAHDSAAGQGGLFEEQPGAADFEHLVEPVAEWSARERLAAERESLGLYLTGHPFDDYAEHCVHFTHGPIRKLLGALPENGQFASRKQVTVAGWIMDVRRRRGRVSLVLNDNTERLEVTLFDDVFNRFGHLAVRDAVVVVEGQLRFDDFLSAWRVTAQRVGSADDAIEHHARRLTIQWPAQGNGIDFVRSLKEALQPFTHGRCEVCVEYVGPTASALLTLADSWSVRPTRELRERLGLLLGPGRFSIHYPKHFL